MSAIAIEFENVSKFYPLYHHVTGGMKQFLFHLPQALRALRRTRFDVLRNVSFTVHKGETFGLIGRNGVGKSTLLGLIAGVLKPSSGEIRVHGRISPLLELGGGFHQDLTGRENAILNGVLLGMRKSEVLAKLDDIICFSELEQFIDQPIRTYSTGMLSRLGFSVVAHLDSDLLLIDEVLAVGDIRFKKKCMERLKEFKQRGVTMVLVSHVPRDIERICDRAMLIDAQRVRTIGSPPEVLERYRALLG